MKKHIDWKRLLPCFGAGVAFDILGLSEMLPSQSGKLTGIEYFCLVFVFLILTSLFIVISGGISSIYHK